MAGFNFRFEALDLGWRDKLTCTSGCRGPHAERPKAVINCAYDYVSGQAGRVSCAIKPACMKHACRFGINHKLDLPLEMIYA